MERDIAEAKRELNQLYKIKCRIDDIRERLVEYKAQITKLSQKYSPTSGCSKDNAGSIVESTVVKIMDMEKYLIDLIGELDRRRLQIMRCIERMDSEDEKLILEYRYVDGMSWDEVRACLGTSRSTVFLLQNRALKSFAEQYNASKAESSV